MSKINEDDTPALARFDLDAIDKATADPKP